MKDPATPALRSLAGAGVEFKTHGYELGHDHHMKQADLSQGEAVSDALGVDPPRLFKTLIAVCNSGPVVANVRLAPCCRSRL